ncbi:MAG: hypothetical protein ACFN25_09700 [Leptotrichia wadei]
MARVLVEPEDLREFANGIRKYLDTVESETNNLKNIFDKLEWNDQKTEEFSERLDELLRILEHFKEGAEEEIPYLLQQAETLEEYLGR